MTSTTYSVIRGGRVVFSATVNPGESHADAWRRALAVAITKEQ